jgi:hypothetical protein
MKSRIHFLYGLVSSFIFFSCNEKHQDFEGIIKYVVKYESTSNEYPIEYLKAHYGDTSIVYIKGGNYKQVYPHTVEYSEVIYHNLTNQYYLLKVGIDSLFYADVGNSNEKYTLKKSTRPDITILGYKCNSIIMFHRNVSTLYYYAPSLPLSAKPFRFHKYGGYNILTKKIKSIYLAKYDKYKDFTISSEAFFIEKKNLQDSIFNLPKLPLKHY